MQSGRTKDSERSLGKILPFNCDHIHEKQPDAKMNNKNIRFRQTKTRSQGKGPGCIWLEIRSVRRRAFSQCFTGYNIGQNQVGIKLNCKHKFSSWNGNWTIILHEKIVKCTHVLIWHLSSKCDFLITRSALLSAYVFYGSPQQPATLLKVSSTGVFMWFFVKLFKAGFFQKTSGWLFLN